MNFGNEMIYDRVPIIADILKPHNEQIITVDFKRGVVISYNRKIFSRCICIYFFLWMGKFDENR
jgi:hypothetical protein